MRVVKLMSVISLMLAPLFKAEWPFQAPQWWAGAILLGVSLVALAIYWVVKMRLERNAADDIEMQQLLVGTPLLHHQNSPSEGRSLGLTCEALWGWRW